MGRSLLDGRNPQSYKDALKRFEGLLLSDVGRWRKVGVFAFSDSEDFSRQ